MSISEARCVLACCAKTVVHSLPKKSQGHGSRTVASECGLSWTVRHKPERSVFLLRESQTTLDRFTIGLSLRELPHSVRTPREILNALKKDPTSEAVCSTSYETFWWTPGASKIIGKHYETFRAWSNLVQTDRVLNPFW